MRMLSYSAMSTSGSSRLTSVDDPRDSVRESSVAEHLSQRLSLEGLLNKSLEEVGGKRAVTPPTNISLESFRAGAVEEHPAEATEETEHTVDALKELGMMDHEEDEGSPATRSSKMLSEAAKMTAKWAASAQEHDEQTSLQGSGDAKTLSPFLRTSATSENEGEYDNFASNYIGNSDYRRLRVLENLELYCKEQICAYEYQGGQTLSVVGPQTGQCYQRGRRGRGAGQ